MLILKNRKEAYGVWFSLINMLITQFQDIKKRPSFYTLFESLLLQNYQSLHPGVLHTVMKEDEYAQSIKSAMTLDRYEEVRRGYTVKITVFFFV